MWIPEPGATELSELTDVDTAGVTNGQILRYDSGSGEWVPDDETGGGGDGGGFGSWTGFTPTLEAATTNPSLGSGGTAEGRYTSDGAVALVHVHWFFGSSPSAGSGLYLFDPPVAVSASEVALTALGSGWLYDDSTFTRRVVTPILHSDGEKIRIGAVHGETAYVQHNTPSTWAQGDRISLQLMYAVD